MILVVSLIGCRFPLDFRAQVSTNQGQYMVVFTPTRILGLMSDNLWSKQLTLQTNTSLISIDILGVHYFPCLFYTSCCENHWRNSTFFKILSTCFCSSIACSVGLSRTGDEERVVTERSLQQLYDAFIAAMNDYTIDSRGDVGAW